MRNMDDARLTDILIETLPHLPYGEAFAARLTDKAKAQLLQAMPGLKERAKTLVELADNAYFIVADRPLALDEKAAAILDADARAILKALLPALRSLAEWNVATTEAVVRDYAAKADLKLGKVAQPLRAALTGRSTSPGVFDVLAVLGREESLARIGDQID